MGSVLTPQMVGIENAALLPNASTFCGKCELVCPVRIPLPKLMRHWREREFEQHLSPKAVRYGIGGWAFFARRPGLYRWLSRAANRVLRLLGGKKGLIHRLPLGGGWTDGRDMPAPSGKTFMQQWKAQQQRQQQEQQQ
jgi:L-lactate dehydrogenase complex protein LldF